jgi:hypothetical protein
MKIRKVYFAMVAFVPLTACSFGQYVDVSGTVKSETGESLAGVAITLDLVGDGSTQSAKFESGSDGSFAHPIYFKQDEFDNGRLPSRFLWFAKDGYI